MPVSTPAETIERLFEILINGSLDDRAELYAPDVVIEMPYAPAAMPSIVQGREELRTRMKAAEGLWSYDKVGNVHLHQTDDPEVVVAEYQVHGKVTATGKAFVFSYIMVTRVRDGLIVSTRDYFNPLESAAALGRTPELLAALLSEGE